jgi:hypothetical protein
MKPEPKSDVTADAPPTNWTRAISGEGGEILTHAVRAGGGHVFLLALGALCLLGGVSGAYWLLSEGELTVAGAIFVLLVPGGVMLFGVYSLNIALWLRHDYLLSRHGLSARTYSLFGDKRHEIARGEIVGIRQYYTPPKSSSASSAKGDWTTFIAYQPAGGGKENEWPIQGDDTEAEARWLGPLLARWANVPLKRGHGAGFEEADPAELPEL